MSRASALAAGRRAAVRGMTDTIAVYEVTQVRNQATGGYDTVTTTVYLGRGKVQTFESYERKPLAAGHQYTVMRPHVHLPVDTAGVRVGHQVAVVEASLSPTLTGSEYTIAGVSDKSQATALRFPVEEVLT